MGVILTGLIGLSVCHPEQNPALAGQNIYKSREVQDKQIVRLLGKIPALAALAYHKCTGRKASPPNQRLSYTENFLYMLDGGSSPNYKPNPRLARALDIMFILHAEHEMNCSTAAARHLASSGVDVYTAMAGAVGALYGPLHGGANEAVLRMLTRIGKVENIPAFLAGVKSKKEKMFGFGHRVYRNFDPRATIIKVSPLNSKYSKSKQPGIRTPSLALLEIQCQGHCQPTFLTLFEGSVGDLGAANLV